MDIVINGEIDKLPDAHVLIPHHGHFYHNISACLGYSKDYPPLADLLRRYHGLEGEWLIVSPIHWQATHNDAMIIASGHELQLSEQESQRWFAAFSDFVAADFMDTYYHDAHIWLLRCDGKPPIVAKGVSTLRHQSMMPELRALDSTLYWQRFITENQMYFSSHPLNKDRDKCYDINGIWIWGNGAPENRTQKPFVCFDPGLVKLANLLSTTVSIYAASAAYSKNVLLLCNQLSPMQQTALNTHLQQHTVRWYWNNVAYQSLPNTWWSRFRGLFKRETINAD